MFHVKRRRGTAGAAERRDRVRGPRAGAARSRRATTGSTLARERCPGACALHTHRAASARAGRSVRAHGLVASGGAWPRRGIVRRPRLRRRRRRRARPCARRACSSSRSDTTCHRAGAGSTARDVLRRAEASRQGASRAARAPARLCAGLPDRRRRLAGLAVHAARAGAIRTGRRSPRSWSSDRTGRVTRGVDRPAGGVADGSRLSRGLRPRRQRAVGVDRAVRTVRAAVPARAAADAAPRPRGAPRVLGVVRVLRRGPSSTSRCRAPIRCWRTCSSGC